jgi:hypothetical protein
MITQMPDHCHPHAARSHGLLPDSGPLFLIISIRRIWFVQFSVQNNFSAATAGDGMYGHPRKSQFWGFRVEGMISSKGEITVTNKEPAAAICSK